VWTKPNLTTGLVFFIRPLVIRRSLEAAVRRTALSRIGESGHRTLCHPWMLRRNMDDGDGFRFASRDHPATQCAGPVGGACNSTIARLIRFQRVCPSRSPRSSIRSARRAAASSASSPCCRISRLAARQMSRSEIIGAKGCEGLPARLSARPGFHAPCVGSTKGSPTAAKERAPPRATRTGDRNLPGASLAAA
jgi:hypothetical protein